MHRALLPQAVRPAATVQGRRPSRCRCSVGSAVSPSPWWTAHSALFTDVRDAAALEALLTTHSDKVVVLEWLSPTCKHCEAAQDMMATVADSLGRSGGVVFARVVCDVQATKALSKEAKVAAFPAVSLHRGGLQLLEFTPSQRGGSEVGARRVEEVINTVAAERRGPGDVHFRMLAGSAQVVDGPAPVEAKRFDYAAMRAAQAQLAASRAADGAVGEDDCDAAEDDEECGVKW